MGVVLRQHLLVLLSTRRGFQPSPYVAEVSRVPTHFIATIGHHNLVLPMLAADILAASIHALLLLLHATSLGASICLYHQSADSLHLPCTLQGASRVAISYAMSDFAKPISSSGLSIADVTLTEDQLSLFLDLGPYANPSPYVVQEDASLSKVCMQAGTAG